MRTVLRVLLLVAAVLQAASGAAQPPLCPACIRVSLTPAQAVMVPAAASGETLLLRVPAGTPEAAWRPAADALRRAGAHLGVHLTSFPADADPLVAASELIAIDVPDDPDAAGILRLKQALVRARGERPSAQLLLLGNTRALAALRAGGLEAYADALLPPARPVPSNPAELLQTPDAVWLLPADALDAARTLHDIIQLESSLQPGLSSTPEGPLRFGEGMAVSGRRSLNVEEIVARHQAFAARQGARIASRIATGTLTLTFEAPGFAAPVTVTSRTIMFVAPDGTDLQEQGISVNGMPFAAGGGVPRLPIIEPERVATPPLAIMLTSVYRYRLAGRETRHGRDCYVVAFSPRDRRQALFAGRAWIDSATFAMARVSAVQTGLRGPITASEQADDFVPDADGRWLLARSDIRQTYEGPGVRTPIHRLLIIDSNDVNPADFDARRAAAYASDDVMLRDTPRGFRYLVREHGAASPERPALAQPARAVVHAARRVRTLAFGVIVDPDISEPLPFAGLSYVDFDLWHTGAQFSGFFGGTFGQAAFSAPSLRGTRWQLAGRAFAIGSSYNDRAFDHGREQYQQDVRQRPASASVWLLRPLTPRVSLRLEYDWEYTKLARADVTDPAFAAPANQVVHAARFGIDAQRAGWQASAWWSPAWRVGWRSWGYGGGAQGTFQRYGASALRTGSLSPRLSGRLEAAWMGGRDLDRFSRYSFGTFDNRLHGYPAALVRYDRGMVARSAIAWSAARAVRLVGFADAARVRDPGFGAGLRPYTGVGAAVEVPVPFGTLLSAEWGYGFQGVGPDGRRGTNVVRITGYKVF